MNDLVYNGYLRLLAKIVGIKNAPRRCRVCEGVLDGKYKKRRAGHLCIECFRASGRARSRKWYHSHKA